MVTVLGGLLQHLTLQPTTSMSTRLHPFVPSRPHPHHEFVTSQKRGGTRDNSACFFGDLAKPAIPLSNLVQGDMAAVFPFASF